MRRRNWLEVDGKKKEGGKMSENDAMITIIQKLWRFCGRQ